MITTLYNKSSMMKKFDFLRFTTFVEQISASEVDFLDNVSTNEV
jgi:hypothetical protein